MHIKKGEKNAKFWIKPEICLAENYGYSSKEINWIEEQVVEEIKLIEDTWNEFFGE